jgi:hypothetical protein
METASPPAFANERLVEAFRHIKSAMEIFERNDPNLNAVRRSLKQ